MSDRNDESTSHEAIWRMLLRLLLIGICLIVPLNRAFASDEEKYCRDQVGQADASSCVAFVQTGTLSGGMAIAQSASAAVEAVFIGQGQDLVSGGMKIEHITFYSNGWVERRFPCGGPDTGSPVAGRYQRDGNKILIVWNTGDEVEINLLFGESFRMYTFSFSKMKPEKVREAALRRC